MAEPFGSFDCSLYASVLGATSPEHLPAAAAAIVAVVAETVPQVLSVSSLPALPIRAPPVLS